MNPIDKINEMPAHRALLLIGIVLIATTPLLLANPAAITGQAPLVAPTLTIGDAFWNRALPLAGGLFGVALVVASRVLRRR